MDKKLARAISDAGWGESQRMMEYKAAWYGTMFIKIDPFYQSSRLCGRCGTESSILTRPDREWQCPVCGTIHDRDINAARSILIEGKHLLAGWQEMNRRNCGDGLLEGWQDPSAREARLNETGINEATRSRIAESRDFSCEEVQASLYIYRTLRRSIR